MDFPTAAPTAMGTSSWDHDERADTTSWQHNSAGLAALAAGDPQLALFFNQYGGWDALEKSMANYRLPDYSPIEALQAILEGSAANGDGTDDSDPEDETHEVCYIVPCPAAASARLQTVREASAIESQRVLSARYRSDASVSYDDGIAEAFMNAAAEGVAEGSISEMSPDTEFVYTHVELKEDATEEGLLFEILERGGWSEQSSVGADVEASVVTASPAAATRPLSPAAVPLIRGSPTPQVSSLSPDKQVMPFANSDLVDEGPGMCRYQGRGEGMNASTEFLILVSPPSTPVRWNPVCLRVLWVVQERLAERLTQSRTMQVPLFEGIPQRSNTFSADVSVMARNLGIGKLAGLMHVPHLRMPVSVLSAVNEPVPPIVQRLITQHCTDHHYISTDDSHNPLLAVHLLFVVQLLHTARREERFLFVHCNAGVNRSVCITAALLMVCYRMPLGQAVRMLQCLRGTTVLLNEYYRLELTLLGQILAEMELIAEPY